MKQNSRHQIILNNLKNYNKVEVEELSKELEVSEMTVRRDLEKLESEGSLVRVFGGAIPIQTNISETPYYDKKVENMVAKKEIAKEAIKIIRDNQTIILDSGTTTYEIANQLIQLDFNLTVITNDITICNVLMNTDIDVIVLGGYMQNRTGSILGSLTFDLVTKLNADLFFLGAHAVDKEYGVTAPSIDKAKLKTAMMNASKETILVADQSKFEKRKLYKVTELERISKIISY
ncbi:DeoR/GlpR transcriptional regulator [Staphylococcus simiae]|uniref:DeoR/GlpR family DNA-binding transcription regulator n=1 Tax=Staphylococcus simiae TaxID=308354 RepID=UPI001A976A07|nr:DeoR/GlpR family DNA-binding transcription regulator [Staphylococcus simiae]MBO1198422.1 DeoR/GlpR transcriptional regulator [Staphylococcus simiae]MBO1200616.1 DeoR/GlpR transcriptional regulator [Staphylococcus simiae]MBO1202887.1 DeoR/GlpR transcriptional regulator [Staphylococcus simiae]MBO1210413.1 DeoR/GlpR transcriptional regulator [Staphylococcus simiae]MBO1228953.1 DeoR/GlpR transcriptional regulator [Staphylococcus simiae]